MAGLFEQIPAGPGPAPTALSGAARASIAGTGTLLVLLGVSVFLGAGAVQDVLVVAYALTVLWWTFAQFREARAGYVTVPTEVVRRGVLRAGLAVLAAGVALVWTTVSYAWGSVLIALGVVLLYWSAGFAIHAARARIRFGIGTPTPVPRLVSRLAFLLTIGFVGLAVLGEWNALVAGGLVVLGFGLAPAVVSMLAEHAVISIGRRAWGQTTTRLVVFGAAFVALGLAAAVSLPKTGAVIGLVALVLVALLLAAIASGTLVDVAVVLGVVALMSTTPVQGEDVPDARPGSSGILVALGDSYMSGEGAREFVPGTDEGGEDECRRAATAWAPMLVRARPELFGGLYFRACSGAKTYNVRFAVKNPETGKELQPAVEGQWDDRTQLRQYEDDLGQAVTPALVVLSIGGNDAGFSTLGLVCLAPGDCDDPVPSALLSGPNIERVKNRLRHTYLDVRRTFPRTPVVVVPYPKPVDSAHVPCAEAPLSEGDVRFVDAILEELNGAIAQVAGEFGFYVADAVAAALTPDKTVDDWPTKTDLRLCSPVRIAKGIDAGINFVKPQTVGGSWGARLNPLAWKHGSLHPNESGHEAMLGAFTWWLDRQTGPGGTTGLAALVRPSARVPGAALPAPPGGERYDAATADADCTRLGGPDTCNDQAKAWAYDQTGRFLLANALVLLLLAGCGWVVGVALTASWRD